MIYRAPGRDRAGLGRFRRTGFGRRKSPGQYRMLNCRYAEAANSNAAAAKSRMTIFLRSLMNDPSLTKDDSSRLMQLEQDKDIIAWMARFAPHKRVRVMIFLKVSVSFKL